MKIQIITIMMMVGMLSLVSAYYPGETVIFQNEIGTEDLVYTIIGNSTPIGNLSIEVNSTNITITFPQDMIPDNFDIVFIEREVEVITEHHYSGGGGGGGSTRYVDRNITKYVYIDVPKYINQTIYLEPEITEPVITQEDKPNKMLVKILIVFAFVLGICLVIYLFYKIFKKEPEEETYNDYDKEEQQDG